MQLSRGGSGGNRGGGAVSGGDLGGEVESSAPTATELMAFVQQHGLQACSIETVMQAWREQRQASRRLSSDGAAAAWGQPAQQPEQLPRHGPPAQQQQPMVLPQQAMALQPQQPPYHSGQQPRQQWRQQPQQQQHHYPEQFAPTASLPAAYGAGPPPGTASGPAAWGPAAVQQQATPQQQPWLSSGQLEQHPHMPSEQQRSAQPQVATTSQPGGAAAAAAAAAGGSRPAQKPASAQKLKQAVLVAGGRAYAAPEPERPSEPTMGGCVGGWALLLCTWHACLLAGMVCFNNCPALPLMLTADHPCNRPTLQRLRGSGPSARAPCRT